MSRQQAGSLNGVVRVRAVRERDSRTGLATALNEQRAAADRVSEIEHLIVTLPAPVTSDLLAFQGRQHSLQMLRESLAAARVDLEAACRLTLAARERWMTDRSRLAAVESLVERRAAAERAERRRREDREQDEVATDLWRRGRALAAANGGAR
ncbi:flagellar FliJ family protein [Nocardioides mangrovi]|uniref:Flagellar FliJ protein n=1 Tax=Nocardioides mangrovi TaxID=2874580 RepID=A0ABS7UA05_9ACTN|nr:flagellar FliJ family protein [Nocardioides mangrovi]MBZ5737814.1 flagellar FliJ family protein [Nocardioides mangrovi]